MPVSPSTRVVRPRIGVLFDVIEDEYQSTILRSMARTSGAAGVQLLCIAGGLLEEQSDHPSAQNFLFDLLQPDSVQAVIALSGALGNRVGMPAFARWAERFARAPFVALGVPVPGMYSVSVGGRTGIREVVSHLVQAHGRRRIAFVRGPTSSVDAEERYEAYREALQEHGLALDSRLVLDGAYHRESGSIAVKELFDARRINVGSVDAIMAANDYMALGVLDGLRERGLGVPGDISVTGFDDIDSSKHSAPPLTTIRQPLVALGREGVRRALSLLHGGKESLSHVLDAEMLRRRSCGCLRVDVTGTSWQPGAQPRSFELAFMERRALIVAELSRSAQGAFVGAGASWEERLISALLQDLKKEADSAFLTALDRLLTRLKLAGSDPSTCQPVLSVLRQAILFCSSGEPDVRARAEDIFDDARTLIANWLVEAETSRRLEMVRYIHGFSLATSSLMVTPDLTAFRNDFVRSLGLLGISTFSVGLFTEPGRVTEHCRCIAAYDHATRFQTPKSFPSRDFGPPEVMGPAADALIVQPLVFHGEPLGIATFALGAADGVMYGQVREILSAALKGFRLAEQLRELQGKLAKDN